MEFGVHLPQIGRTGSGENIRRLAERAEALGYESCWVSDHVTIPERIASRYPYGNGRLPVGPEIAWLDPLGTLCFAAACTERVALGISVLVLGLRPPVQTAKLIATLDVLSGGRLILGIGVGWMEEEFEAVGMPWDHRGARADEQLEVFDALFTQDRPEHHGRFYEFERIGFNPKPIRGRVPIWVGGSSPAAYRRAARYGDNFHSVASTTPPSEVQQQWEAVHRFAEEQGRDPDSVALSLRAWLRYGAEDIGDGSFSGSDDQIVESIERWAAIGVSHIAMDIVSPGGIEQQVESIERFAANVRPQLG